MAVKTNYSKNGIDYYRVTASVGRDSAGKLIRKEFYGKSKKDAENKKDEYLDGLKNGLNINFKEATLGRLMKSWLFEVVKVKVKPTSFEKYEGIYRNYLLNSEIYGAKISDLKSLQLQRFYNELFKNGKSSNSIKSLNKLLKSFLNYAVDEGYLLKNPCAGKKIIIPGENEKNFDEDTEVQIFTNDEIKKLREVMEGSNLKPIVLMALGTGLRQGELLALKWSNIAKDYSELRVEKTIKRVKIIEADDTSRHEIILQAPKTKKSQRTVPIPSKLIPILEEQKLKQNKEKAKAGNSYIDEKFIFATGNGKPVRAKNLFNSYKSLLIKAGIEHKKFHALRHTFATKLFEKDIPLKTVSELLGHSDISITADIYTHVMPKQKVIATEKLNDLFD
jgi:integrase